MKTLYLFRHATAERRREELPDFDRALTKKGKRETEKVAGRFRDEKIGKPQLVISSPAKRAIETAAVFNKKIGGKKKSIVLETDIYEQGHEALLRIVKNLDDQIETAVMVGHNPSFEDLCVGLLKTFDRGLSKAGLVGIQFNTEHWKNIRRGQGNLVYFDYPGRKAEEDEIGKLGRKLLADRIALAVQKQLKAVDPTASESISETILQSSTRLAKEFIKATKGGAGFEAVEKLVKQAK